MVNPHQVHQGGAEMTRAELITIMRREAAAPVAHTVRNAVYQAKAAGSITESEFHVGLKIANRVPDSRFRNSSLYGDVWRALKLDLPNYADWLEGRVPEFHLTPTLL